MTIGDPISADEVVLDLAGAPEADQSLKSAMELTPADREALRASLAGLAPLGADWGSHDPNRDPDADADAAERGIDR